MSVLPFQIYANGRVGVDYFRSDSKIKLSDERTLDLGPDGPGISLGWDFSDNWSISLNHSRTEGRDIDIARNAVFEEVIGESESTINTLGALYYKDNFWVSLAYSKTNDDQSIRSSSVGSNEITILEKQKGSNLSIELGREWAINNWAPSLGVSLSHQSTDINRALSSSSLSGTDLGLSASLFYYYELSQALLLSPSVSLHHQINIDGDISGRRLRYAGNAVSFSRDLDTEDETSGNLAVSLLVGDWAWSAGFITSFSSSETGDAWFLGASYSF